MNRIPKIVFIPIFHSKNGTKTKIFLMKFKIHNFTLFFKINLNKIIQTLFLYNFKVPTLI